MARPLLETIELVDTWQEGSCCRALVHHSVDEDAFAHVAVNCKAYTKGMLAIEEEFHSFRFLRREN